MYVLLGISQKRAPLQIHKLMLALSVQLERLNQVQEIPHRVHPVKLAHINHLQVSHHVLYVQLALTDLLLVCQRHLALASLLINVLLAPTQRMGLQPTISLHVILVPPATTQPLQLVRWAFLLAQDAQPVFTEHQ
jgi:hypothetical protein